jgi:hypothetical protein
MPDAALAEREPDLRDQNGACECAEGIVPKSGLWAMLVKDEMRVFDAGSSFRMYQQSGFNMLQRAVPAQMWDTRIHHADAGLMPAKTEHVALLIVVDHRFQNQSTATFGVHEQLWYRVLNTAKRTWLYGVASQIRMRVHRETAKVRWYAVFTHLNFKVFCSRYRCWKALVRTQGSLYCASQPTLTYREVNAGSIFKNDLAVHKQMVVGRI